VGPGNKYSICKDWGSTGWIYDKTIVKREIKTWADFIDVAMNEASGNTSVLDAPVDVCGIYFWANGIPWTTTDPAQLSACEDFMVNQFASTSRPSIRTRHQSHARQLRAVAGVER
jgi:spermidine/putrescine transport system substrate-binding protein